MFSPEAWLGYCQRVLRRRKDLRGKFAPDDLLSEAFLRAWRQRDSFRGETRSAAAAWFARIVRRTAEEMSRGLELRDFERGIQSIDEPKDREADPMVAGHRPTRSATEDGLEAIERTELRELLLRSISRLPALEAYAILEIRLGAASVREVAERLSTSRHAVSTLLWKGTRRLEKQMRRVRLEGA